MGILNSLDVVWNNALAIIVVFFVFYWVYKNMEDNKFKRWIEDMFEKMKESLKGER